MKIRTHAEYESFEEIVEDIKLLFTDISLISGSGSGYEYVKGIDYSFYRSDPGSQEAFHYWVEDKPDSTVFFSDNGYVSVYVKGFWMRDLRMLSNSIKYEKNKTG